MKFSRIIVILIAAAAASCSNGFEIPPVSFTGGNPGLAQGGKTTMEQYDQALAWLTKQHLYARKALELTPPNFYSASKEIRGILKNLQKMQALTAEPTATDIGEYIARYSKLLEAVERHTAGQTTIDRLTRYEREIKSRFSTGQVPILVEVPREGTKPKKDGKKATKKEDEDADALPPPEEERAGDDAEPEKPVEKAPKQKDTGDLPFWVLYKSWQQVHADLVSAYGANRECGRHYERVTRVVEMLAAAAEEGESRDTLLLCGRSYGAVHKKTEGFTSLPEKLTRENILAQLEQVADIIRSYFDPDKN
ncbi:MAG: hypothetical protein ACYTAF_00415 [Planctomycetota bacterium]|jgi:hypothetical protein